jgi:hypothetical protein
LQIPYMAIINLPFGRFVDELSAGAAPRQSTHETNRRDLEHPDTLSVRIRTSGRWSC